MFTTFTVKKPKEPKKIIRNLFVTKQVLPKKSPQKKVLKKIKPMKKPRKKILYKTQKPKEAKTEPEIKIEKIEPKIENKIVIPKQLLTAPVIDTSKEPKTDKEIALFMLDIYEAYEKCAINLKSISKILDAQDRG
jgi:hypothetical protein